jgi:hypothetical protein
MTCLDIGEGGAAHHKWLHAIGRLVTDLSQPPHGGPSRGFGSSSYQVKPLVSYETCRQLSGWILPTLAKRTIGAH